ncbi:MAG TPA: hypothetical protein VJA16_19570 [Thermoanaerobaculia bacterium]
MVTRAVQGGFRVVPVLLVDVELPPLLASRIWVDLRQTDGPADLYWLTRQRTTLGEERFRTVLREHLGDEGSSKVVGMLDSAAGREGGTDMGGAPGTADQP